MRSIPQPGAAGSTFGSRNMGAPSEGLPSPPLSQGPEAEKGGCLGAVNTASARAGAKGSIPEPAPPLSNPHPSEPACSKASDHSILCPLSGPSCPRPRGDTSLPGTAAAQRGPLGRRLLAGSGRDLGVWNGEAQERLGAPNGRAQRGRTARAAARRSSRYLSPKRASFCSRRGAPRPGPTSRASPWGPS